jgi:hypothetical protein
MKKLIVKCKTCKHIKYSSTNWVDEILIEARDMIDLDKIELLKKSNKLKCSKCGSKDIMLIIIKDKAKKIKVNSSDTNIKIHKKRIYIHNNTKNKRYLDIVLNIIENKEYLYINEIDKVFNIKDKIAINESLGKSEKEFINNIYNRIPSSKKNVY